jgi:hypothetical protein
MNGQWRIAEHRLLELLADRATFGLTSREEEELRRLLASVPHFDEDCMEKAAANVQLAFASVEPLPASVYTKIRASGEGYVAESS